MTDCSSYIAEQLGTRKWCVSPRLTPRLKAKGFERAVSSDTLQALEREWAHDNPDLARADKWHDRHLHQLALSEDELLAVAAALRARARTLADAGMCGASTLGALRAVALLLPDAPPVQRAL